MIVVLGDFNAQTQGLYHLGKRTYGNTRTDGVSLQFRMEQLIHEPIDINGDKSSLDLNFASQPDLVVESSYQSSLYTTINKSNKNQTNQQIVLVKFNNKAVYPLPYERESWHFFEKHWPY